MRLCLPFIITHSLPPLAVVSSVTPPFLALAASASKSSLPGTTWYVRNFLGKLQAVNGQPAAALERFDEAIKLNPDNRWFYVNKAGVQAELRDLPNALATTRALTTRYPQWSIGLNLEAALLDGLDRTAEAIQAYERAVAATPPSAQILTNQGMLLRRLGRQADARASYEAALRLQPGYSRAAAELASLPR